MSANFLFARPSSDIIARYRALRIDAVAREIGNDHIADPAIKPLAGFPLVVGPAFTVQTHGPDARMAILALGAARFGDVIVIANDGPSEGAGWGGGLTLSADEIGCEAVAIDGAAVDVTAIAGCRTPVFARGVTLRIAADCALGRLACPIHWGGVAVTPGDLVMGDADGLCIVPQHRITEVLVRAEAETSRIAGNIARLVGSGRTMFDLRGGPSFAASLGVAWPAEP